MKLHIFLRTVVSLRLLRAFALLIAAPLLQAQFTSSGGVTTTPDSVGVGVAAPLAAKLHVFSATDNNVLALWGKSYNNYSTAVTGRFYDTLSAEGYCCGLIEELQGNSAITVSNLRFGYAGTPIVTSLAGQPLYLNSMAVLGFTPGDVVVGYNGLPNGLRVNSAGNSSFAGNVGIGTTAPPYALDVSGRGRFTGWGTPATSGAGAEIGYDGTNGYLRLYDRSTAAYKPLLLDGNNIVMQTGSAGNVGIGISNPDARLEVVGTGHFTQNVTVDGIIYAKYQDVAEWVPAGGTLEPGTVVVLNRAKANEVATSTKAYDTAVAGVVSDQPGLLLGTPAEGRAKIATTGRVKVRVDARTHPVNIGDLLVTSEVPGTAMVSEPLDLGGTKIHRPGTLIGKALEPLPSGEGEILVLLSLQ